MILEHKLLVFCSGNFPLCSCVRGFSPIFSSIRFSVSGFMWKSLIHFDLIFAKGDKYETICILIHADCQFDEYHLLKMLSFCFVCFGLLCPNSSFLMYVC